MLAERYPLYLGGERHAPNADLVVTDRYTGEVRLLVIRDALR